MKPTCTEDARYILGGCTEDARYMLGRERSKMVSPIAFIAGEDPRSPQREADSYHSLLSELIRSSSEAHSAKVLVGPNEGRSIIVV